VKKIYLGACGQGSRQERIRAQGRIIVPELIVLAGFGFCSVLGQKVQHKEDKKKQFSLKNGNFFD
jgi:hypothetical protein